MKYDIAQPYLAVYIVFRKAHKIAFVLRSNTDWMNNYYGLIAGKVEKDETLHQAAMREAQEEAGVLLKPEDLKHILTAYRYSQDNDMYWLDVFFEAQSWQGELVNAEPHMHSELAWLDPNSLPANVIPAVRFCIEQIQLGKTFTEHGWPE